MIFVPILPFFLLSLSLFRDASSEQTTDPTPRPEADFQLLGKADDKPADPPSGRDGALSLVEARRFFSAGLRHTQRRQQQQREANALELAQAQLKLKPRLKLKLWLWPGRSSSTIRRRACQKSFGGTSTSPGGSASSGTSSGTSTSTSSDCGTSTSVGSPATTTTNNQSGRGSLAPGGRGTTRGRGGARGGVQSHRGGYAQDAQDRRRTFIQGIVGRSDGGALSRHQYDLFLGGGIQVLEADQHQHQLQLQQRQQRQAARA
ncbi:hypothetical protein Trisim1_010263 [Trichoderma cf. simile WF8]